MPTFAYVARDQQGVAHTGQLDGVDDDDVVASLQRRGLLVTSISKKDLAQSPKLSAWSGKRRMHGRVTVDDQVLLCQQLATLVGAGIPLLRSLEVVSVQVESRRLLAALEQIHRDVTSGSTLVAALGKHPTIFSKMWLNLVETGEASGHLAQSLQQLAGHFESSRHLQNEAKTALTYPAFLILVAIGVSAVFVYWLIPTFTEIFQTMPSMRLPLITRILIAISQGARHYFIVGFLALAAAVYLLRRFLRTEAGQWTRDRLILRLPLMQSVMAYVQLAEFSHGLSTLLESGVPLLTTLDILGSGATNRVYGQAINAVREEVREGKTMAEPMGQHVIFPPMMVQMVQVGEEIGELAQMSGRVSKYYEERAMVLIARMTRLFEPIAICVMAFIVLFIVLAIFMPIFQMSSGGGL